jgi:hypothetical protein
MMRPSERLRLWRLRLWLGVMSLLEARGLEDSGLYLWATRRAAGCNSWRRWHS